MNKFLKVSVTIVIVAGLVAFVWDSAPQLRRVVMILWSPWAPIVMPYITRAMNGPVLFTLIVGALFIAVLGAVLDKLIRPGVTQQGSIPKR